ncbi:CCT domain [Dillenia turbinata]|uniref:CCT domain n=1 Tax=Dillenia turbinata TaxID=194707 RepID=A0AAN8V1P0_9MAGN
MYGYTNTSPNSLSNDYISMDHSSSSSNVPLDHNFQRLSRPSSLVIAEFDMVHTNSSNSSGCNSSYESPTAVGGYSTHKQTLMQRSVSSHSLQKNNFHHPIAELLDSDTSSVRRVFSTGDLEHSRQSESPLSNESCMAIIEGMSRACRYSPEEKKERIERYRSKRNQRNFNKKIKYACRKTLADSRPRIRGRFARNDELEKISQDQWNQMNGEEEDEDDDNYWINFLGGLPGNLVP